MMRSAWTAAAVLILTTGPCFAAQDRPQNPDRALRRVEGDLSSSRARDAELARDAEALERELGELRVRLIQSSDEERRTEAELTRLEQALRTLEQEERTRSADLDAQRAQIAELLGALTRVSRVPPEALIARPEAPTDALRTALLLRAAVPALRSRAESLAEALRQFAELRADLAARRSNAEAVRVRLAARQADIAALVARREELQRRTAAERVEVAQRMETLASEAKDLRSLIEKLERERREAERRRREEERRKAEEAARLAREKSEAEARAKAEAEARERDKREQQAALLRLPEAAGKEGNLRLPVVGAISVQYGDKDRVGVTSRGVTIASRPEAQVVSPFTGSIMFAGPFRGYGLILIVEHPNGYHSLIAGLGRIDTAVGQHVLAGEPVGVMGSPTDGNPELYFELRRNGQPINPQRGMSASDGKGQG
jgi:septal ring factor EnvC (AmiA/AmiB activator)